MLTKVQINLKFKYLNEKNVNEMEKFTKENNYIQSKYNLFELSRIPRSFPVFCNLIFHSKTQTNSRFLKERFQPSSVERFPCCSYRVIQ